MSKDRDSSEAGLMTVVIPTLNRSETLRSAIMTCLEQPDDYLRVIVSDNASDDDTAAVVASFTDTRLRYIKPERRLGMSEHWEFALSHVEDGFVTVMGDDDGLLKGAVAKARNLLFKTGAQVITWEKVEYCWPDHIIPDYRNWLYIPTGNSIRRLNSIDVVKSVLDFRIPYNKLPCIYNSFISMDILGKYKAKNGRIFGGMAPDVYSAFSVADSISEYYFSDEPLSINGASSKSNGTLHTQGDIESQIVKNFRSDTNFDFEPGLPKGRVIEFAVVDAFYKVQRNSALFQREWVDNGRVLESAISSASSGIRSDDVYENWLASIREFADGVALLADYERLTSIGLRRSEAGHLPPFGVRESAIVFDARTMGIRDVWECSARSSEILAFRAAKPDLFESAAATKAPLVAISLLARAGAGPVRLHLGCGYAYFDGYVNVDYPQSEHSVMTVRPDVACNINDIDLPDGCIDEVRLQHVFEHFNRAVALGSVIRWQRWLKSGGKLHIETPDFEASAKDFLSAPTLELKMRAIRHLEGDQADAWAYHVGQWFPERFQKTFEALGFENIEIRQDASGHTPPLFNVTAIGYKSANIALEQQMVAGSVLLQDHMVADAEQPTWEVWCSQLAAVLRLEGIPQPAIGHPASAQLGKAKGLDGAPINDPAPNAVLRSRKQLIRKALLIVASILIAVLASPVILFVAILGFATSIGFAFFTIWVLCAHLIRRLNSWRLGRESTPLLRTALDEFPVVSAIARRFRTSVS
jgi:glycosyltransferase involved in cell wall biosynthesis